jgi:rRNA-processing protein FCF1
MEKSYDPTVGVALDTNMLLAVSQLKLDIFEMVREKFDRVDFMIPKQVIQELDKLVQDGNSDAKIAKKWLKTKSFSQPEGTQGKYADDVLLGLAKQGFWVATNDQDLRKGIKRVGGKSIYIRKKKVIALSSDF